MKDYYQILEVPPNASLKKIKEQYRFLVHAWHPDKFPNSAQKEKAQEKVKEINEAYEVLSNPTKRAQYDREWSGSGFDEQEREQEKAQAEAEQRRAEHEQKQREQAEEERQRAEYERQQRERAEEERRRSEQELRQREQAEAERRRTEYERQQEEQAEAKRLLAKKRRNIVAIAAITIMFLVGYWVITANQAQEVKPVPSITILNSTPIVQNPTSTVLNPTLIVQNPTPTVLNPTPIVQNPTPTVLNRDELSIGQSWQGNGLELRLDRVEVGTDSVNTRFYVTNLGNDELTFPVGPNEGYFTLIDNKGRAWPPTDMLSGEVVLSGGQTSDDIGPRFDGSLLSDSKVTELNLVVQGLLGVQQLTWRIQINQKPIPSSDDTSIGTELAVGQEWHWGGRIFKLDRIEISQDNVNTKFYVTNQTTAPFVFEPQFDQGYFELRDNNNRIWPAISGITGRIALAPGETTGDIGPRFDGTFLTDLQVTQLTLMVRGLLDVPEAKWVFSVNTFPANPSKPDTPVGSLLTVGLPWRFSDLVFRLDRVEIGSSEINTKFYVTNYTESTFVFETGSQYNYFTLTDSKGRTWAAITTPEGRTALSPGDTSGDIGPRFDGGFLSDKEVSYVILKVQGLLGISEASWKIDIVR